MHMINSVIKKVNQLFDLPTLTYVGKAKGGFLSDNYIVKNKDNKYFLKKYRATVESRLPAVNKSEEFFANENIPVILPIKTKTGKSYFTIEGNSYSLFPFVNARTFNHRTGKLTPTIAKSIASNLATMHLLSKKEYPRIADEQLSEWDPKRIYKSFDNFKEYSKRVLDIINKKTKKSAFDKLALEIISLKIKVAATLPRKFKSSDLGKNHLVHGDYHAQNVFINRKGELTHVFDLEKTDIRPRSTELTRSMMIICFNSYFTPERFQLAKIYLQAYNEIYPIKKEEVASAIRLMFNKHVLNLWIEKERYINHNNRPSKLLPGEMRFLKYMSKNLEKFIEKLVKVSYN